MTKAADVILDWYDRNARDLPWRVPPLRSQAGELPDPYRVWLSEIMLQQTSVAAVKGYFHTFTARWPDVQALAAAADGDVMAVWAGLGYYARARNLLKCARIIGADYDGYFPDTREALQTLPGIGPYTSAAIAAIAFGRGETVVDGNVERVMARLFACEVPLPGAKPELVALAHSLTPQMRAGDYAQAVMDIGATVCTPRNPSCANCPVSTLCQGLALGIAGELPKRTRKSKKPIRNGIVYVARRADGALLLERRADQGLLGGMLGWPTGEWGDAPVDCPPIRADWQMLPEQVRHTFTHFHLVLEIRLAEVAISVKSVVGDFITTSDFNRDDLPTVMRKVFDVAMKASIKESGEA